MTRQKDDDIQWQQNKLIDKTQEKLKLNWVNCLTGGPHWVLNCARGAWAAADGWNVLMSHLIAGLHFNHHLEPSRAT